MMSNDRSQGGMQVNRREGHRGYETGLIHHVQEGP